MGSEPIHGMSNTPTYWAWSAMVARCTNPKNPRYRNYGGRGIKVCKQWRSFSSFLADMGPRPNGKRGSRSLYSLDRKDNDGDYEPSNCRWATVEQQNANKRDRDWSYVADPIYRKKMRRAANRRWNAREKSNAM
jgi:hypothetical protein